MSTIALELVQLYQRTFGSKPFQVNEVTNNATTPTFNIAANQNGSVLTGTPLTATDLAGVEIWLPIWLTKLPANIGDNGTIFLPYATVKISGASTIIRTPMVERKGSVKELYSIDDYKITIKGFFIDKVMRSLPVSDLNNLRLAFEQGTAFSIENALTDVFLQATDVNSDELQRVVMSSFDIPEMSGGKKSCRAFVMELESDSIFTLEYADN